MLLIKKKKKIHEVVRFEIRIYVYIYTLCRIYANDYMLVFFCVLVFLFVCFWKGEGKRKEPEEIKFSSWGYAELFGEGVLMLR